MANDFLYLNRIKFHVVTDDDDLPASGSKDKNWSNESKQPEEENQDGGNHPFSDSEYCMIIDILFTSRENVNVVLGIFQQVSNILCIFWSNYIRLVILNFSLG